MKFSLRHKSSGKPYAYIAQVAYLMLLGFFRKIHLSNRKGLPVDKPVLLAANHPTAFLDPILLCTLLDPPLYNMTRGDMFRKPLYRALMESINMFPVFRVRDGYTGRDRNDEVFEFCERQLLQNRVVTIYVEGEHHLEKHVRPVRKGIVRIAFDTYEKNRLEELQIVPAGCNYVWGDQPREEAMVNIGRPIFVRDYWDLYQQDQKQGMAVLSAAIESGLREVCFHIKDLQDAPLLERILTLHRSENPEPHVPVVVFNKSRFKREKEICDCINALAPEPKQELKTQCQNYFTLLGKAGLSDAPLLHPEWGAWWRLLGFLLGFLPFIVGYMSSFPVVWFAKTLTQKVVKKREFYSSVWIGAGFIGAVISWNPWWIAIALSLPILAWFSMFYRENWRDWVAVRKALRNPQREQLLQARKEIQF